MKIVDRKAFENAQTFAKGAVYHQLSSALTTRGYWCQSAMLSLKRAYGLS